MRRDTPGVSGRCRDHRWRHHGLGRCVSSRTCEQKRVILLEKQFVDWASSGVNAGGVRRQGRHPAEMSLAQASLQDWVELPALVGTDCGFVPCDHLSVAESDAEMEQLIARIPYHTEAGVKLEVLGRAQMQRICPDFGHQVMGGTLCRGDGQANLRLVSPAFARKTRDMGAIITVLFSLSSS